MNHLQSFINPRRRLSQGNRQGAFYPRHSYSEDLGALGCFFFFLWVSKMSLFLQRRRRCLDFHYRLWSTFFALTFYFRLFWKCLVVETRGRLTRAVLTYVYMRYEIHSCIWVEKNVPPGCSAGVKKRRSFQRRVFNWAHFTIVMFDLAQFVRVGDRFGATKFDSCVPPFDLCT